MIWAGRGLVPAAPPLAASILYGSNKENSSRKKGDEKKRENFSPDVTSGLLATAR